MFKKIFNIIPLLFISISISSIIFLFSITSTIKKDVLRDIENMGAYILNLSGDCVNNYDEDKMITYEDLLYLKRRCRFIKGISMEAMGDRGGGTFPIWLKDKKYLSECQAPLGIVLGILPDYRKIKSLKVIEGRFINETDIRLKRKVCVLGNSTAMFFGGKKVIGKKIVGVDTEWPSSIPPEQISPVLKEPLTVVGILGRKDAFSLPIFSSEFWDIPDAGVFVPYTALKDILKYGDPKCRDFLAQTFIQIRKIKHTPEKVIKNSGVIFYPDDKFVTNKEEGLWGVHKDVKDEAKAIIDCLKERYGERFKVLISSNTRLLDELEFQRREMNVFIVSVGVASLIASIISILSLMLLTVHNRRAEIGLRRAIGARKKDIFLQFLKEALLITTKGGAVGIILGLFLVWLMGKYTGWDMVIPIYSLFLSIATIALIGVISGVYPAIKAANIPPAVAVKYE